MALPPGVVGVLGELVMSPKVQDFATKLVKDVYGKIMPSQGSGDESEGAEQKPRTLDDLAERIDELPTKQELITSFAVLQAELEREHRKTHFWLRAVFALQIFMFLVILGIFASS